MLGLGKFKTAWNWAACGKHPVAKDYFRLNLNTPILTAFESWVEEGYQDLKRRQRSFENLYSWRFWAKGIKKGSLICGVGKDSSDGIGRPYPLLIMGDGILDGWETDWNLLLTVLERTWDQIEYISSRRFDSVKELEKEIRVLKNPNQDWVAIKSKAQDPNNAQSASNDLTILKNSGEIREKARHLAQKKEVLVPLDSRIDDDPFTVAGLWSTLLKEHSSDVPNAVFLGGIPEKHFLAVFNRSLNANDFIRLWSISSYKAND